MNTIDLKTANRLIAYEDKSMNWDAWDIDKHYRRKHVDLTDADTRLILMLQFKLAR